MLTLDQHLYGKGRKRILSLDGGGVRGLFTLGILARLEEILGARYEGHYVANGKTRADFRLCDYFDLIGGTSTGGIIAAMLCLGMTVEDIRKAYLRICPRIFAKDRKGMLDWILNPYGMFAPSFDATEFRRAIDEIMTEILEMTHRKGQAPPQLESEMLRTGLALLTKRIDTGRVWLVTNNKRAKYWDPAAPYWAHVFESDGDRFYPNAKYPVGVLVQATASAPFLLDAAELAISPREVGVFLDGGASPHNNPALELLLATTLREYDEYGRVVGPSPSGFDWEASDDQLYVLSVGTGTWQTKIGASDYQAKRNWEKAKIALLSVIDDGAQSALAWLEAMSRPVGTASTQRAKARRYSIANRKLLTFNRIDLTLDVETVNRYLEKSITETMCDHLKQLDNADKINLQRLDELGRTFANNAVSEADLPANFDPYPSKSNALREAAAPFEPIIA